MNKIIIYILLFIVSFVLVYNDNYKIIYNDLLFIDHNVYKGSDSRNKQLEIEVIFITSSNCAYSNVKDLPGIIDRVKVTINEKAKKLGYSFNTIAVSADENVEDGLSSLRKFGVFDEIAIGNKWSNLGTIKYIYDELKGVPITPQIVLTKRVYQTRIVGDTLYRIGIDKEDLILRIVGINEIRNWAKRGLPLPSDYEFNI